MRFWRFSGIGVLGSAVVCPCHVLVGAVGLLTGGAVLSPAVQDGAHAVYVPLAVLFGAALLRLTPRSSHGLQRGSARTQGVAAEVSDGTERTAAGGGSPPIRVSERRRS